MAERPKGLEAYFAPVEPTVDLVQVVMPPMAGGLQIGMPKLYFKGRPVVLPLLVDRSWTIEFNDRGLPKLTLCLPVVVLAVAPDGTAPA